MLGSMLNDVSQDIARVLPVDSVEEARTSDEVASAWIEDVGKALEDGTLYADCLLHTLGPATCDLAMDLAARADRAQHGSQVPISDEWGDFGEHEETQIGFAMAKWLRRRLPRDQGSRRDLYQQVMKGLQAQLAQEARHLRRLHAAFHSLSAMGVGTLPGSDEETSAEDLHREAKDMVDQLVMEIGRETDARDIRTWLGMSATSSSSTSSTPSTYLQGNMRVEVEALRRRLNAHFEGVKDELGLWMEQQPEGFLDDKEKTEGIRDGVQGEGDDLDVPGDDTNSLMEKPGKGRPSSRPEGRRSRTRSRSRGQSTWSTATASGWRRHPPGGSGSDGNNHRPWRREPVEELWNRCGGDVLRRAREGDAGEARSSSGRESRSPRENDPRPNAEAVNTSVLPSGFRAHAWHCLLDMADPMTTVPSSNWEYGLRETGRQNVRASFASMPRLERERMLVSLLRTMSLILQDIADSVQAAEADRGEEEVEGDETGLVQTGLTGDKKRKLEDSSRKVDVTGLVGTTSERMARSLVSALERMNVDEARRCAQGILVRLQEHYGFGEVMPGNMPMEVEGLVSAMVTFGAEVGVPDADDMTKQDHFFTTHWWGMLQHQLPSSGSMPGSLSLSSSSRGPETTGGRRSVPFVSLQGTSGQVDLNSSQTGAAVETVEATAVEKEVEDAPASTAHALPGRVGDLCGGDREDREAHACDHERADQVAEGQGPVHAESCVLREGRIAGEGRECQSDDSLGFTEVQMEVEKWRAARYREWEEWLVRDEMSNPAGRPRPGGMRVTIKGGVRSAGGLLGVTQTMGFELRPDETVDLSLRLDPGREPWAGRGFAGAQKDESEQGRQGC